MLVTFFSDQIVYEIGNEAYAKDALKVAEEKIEYLNRIDKKLYKIKLSDK
jgi:hypothetical protein